MSVDFKGAHYPKSVIEATSWQPHSARGMISGALKKKLGLEITTMIDSERGRVYHIHGSR